MAKLDFSLPLERNGDDVKLIPKFNEFDRPE